MTVAAPQVQATGRKDVRQPVFNEYLDSIHLIERLHRQFLEVVKGELDRLGVQDINNIQALILYNIGKDDLTVGELTNRGYYLGSNVSYNVRKMVENDYLVQERSTHDKRSVRVRASDKGLQLWARLDDMFKRHAERMTSDTMNGRDLQQANAVLQRLERFWNSPGAYGAPLPGTATGNAA
jgi:DNA-binding MarR family transcriptional regulator